MTQDLLYKCINCIIIFISMQKYYQDNIISNSAINNSNKKKKKNLNNQMDMEAKFDITNINVSRVQLGLKPIKSI